MIFQQFDATGLISLQRSHMCLWKWKILPRNNIFNSRNIKNNKLMTYHKNLYSLVYSK